MLRDKGFQVPDINMKAYMKARAMTQESVSYTHLQGDGFQNHLPQKSQKREDHH